MNTDILKAKFARIGARLQINGQPINTANRPNLSLTLDVRSDVAGEFFDIRLRAPGDLELQVVDVRRRERHLLLRATERHWPHYYLCGHDERHWFVAAIPERAGELTNIFSAMEALKPPEVLAAQRRQGIKGKDRHRRKNAAYLRQGEWFFVPAPKLHVEKMQVLFNEPLSRGEGSTPHRCEFLYRTGGERVYVCDLYPQGVRWEEYYALLRDKPRAKSWRWRTMQRNPEAYVKGKISHPDHKSIQLFVWHKVMMNTESQSQAKRHVVFLD